MVVSPAKRRAVEALAIDDGIRIHFMPARKFKTAVFCALVRRTLTKEEATQNAVLPGVLMRGCEKYNTFGKMQAAVEDLYGSVYDCMIVKKGEEQILEFYFDGLTVNDAFYNGLSFLKEAMLNPLAPNGAFKEEYFQGAIENQKNEIESRINNKAEYCKQKLFERMCEKERFSVYAGGSLDELGGLTGKSLLAHYWKILRSSQIDFFCLGDLDPNELQERALSLFTMPGRKFQEHPLETEVVYVPKKTDIYRESLGSSQGKIAIGLRADCRQQGNCYTNMMLLNEILGGGSNSKLFVNLREKESLCYYINSVYYRFKSIIVIQSGVAPENFGRVLELSLSQVEKIKNGEISDSEWESAKTSLIGKFRGSQDYPSATIDFYTVQHMLGDTGDIDDVIQKIKSARRDDVSAMASTLYADAVYQLE